MIDGGNSWYRLDVDRATALTPNGIHYVDVGTSGGVAGLERGYCLMIGGADTAVGRLHTDLRHAGTRRRRCRTHTGPNRRARPGGAGVAALRTDAAPVTS